VVAATSVSDTELVKSADAFCPAGKVAIGGGGGITGDGGNEDFNMETVGPVDAGGNLGAGNAGWRARARNVLPGGVSPWSVSAYAICAVVE
jgi:hypothetical protein